MQSKGDRKIICKNFKKSPNIFCTKSARPKSLDEEDFVLDYPRPQININTIWPACVSVMCKHTLDQCFSTGVPRHTSVP